MMTGAPNPSASISSDSSSRRFSRRATTATRHPSAASTLAAPRPMPRLAPVTRQLLPCSCRSIRCLQRRHCTLRRMSVAVEVTSSAVPHKAWTLRRVVTAGLVGNVLEWYDFAIYGFFAPILAAQFFPSGNRMVSLLAAFGAFAVGFLMRPVGAAVFGHIGDRYGRARALLLSVAMMAIPTVLMGLLPTYATIGIAASFLIVLLRMFQGMAVGGEFTSSIVFLAERAPPSRRGFFASMSMFGATTGTLLGAAVGAALSRALSAGGAGVLGLARGVPVGNRGGGRRDHHSPQPVRHADHGSRGGAAQARRAAPSLGDVARVRPQRRTGRNVLHLVRLCRHLDRGVDGGRSAPRRWTSPHCRSSRSSQSC